MISLVSLTDRVLQIGYPLVVDIKLIKVNITPYHNFLMVAEEE